MTKSEFLEKLARNGSMSRSEAEKILNAFLDSIEDGLCKDGNITLRHFGSFLIRQRNARTGRHPVTGELMDIPASRTVAFLPASDLKTCINN